jgi:polysaccharide deacetylase family sporulation protein PdaB
MPHRRGSLIGREFIVYTKTESEVRKMKARLQNLRKRKKLLGGAAMLVLVALIFSVVNSPLIVGASATTRRLPIYCVQREDKVASLTFDAAWGNEDTKMLIDILGKYGVKATFFVVGDWVDKYPESVKQLHDAGHEVMGHSNDHAHFSKLTEAQIVENINACNDKIEAVTGVRPTLFRAPYGEYDDHVISTVDSMGIHTIQWDVDSLDWKDLSAADITKRVTSKAAAGSIILFHNAAKNTPEALPAIIENLLGQGFTLIPVSEIILDGEYTIDHTGRQIPAANNNKA